MSELEISSTLYKIYPTLVRIETDELKDNKSCSDLTVNELNLIECIRSLTKGSEGPTISEIAVELEITRPSTTVAVNKLVSKRIVTKTTSKSDGRSVKVKLTAKGEKAFGVHHSFQNKIMKDVRESLSEEQYNELRSALNNLESALENRQGSADASAKK